MMILLAGVLGACSSMSVDDPYIENYPADFSVQEYMALHPQLRSMQYKEAVSAYNDSVSKVMGGAYTAAKKTDDSLFMSNMDVLRAIFLDPYMGGGTQERWDKLLENKSSTDTSISNTAKRNFNSLSGFNFINQPDDILLLSQVPVDYDAIARQYSVFGRDHGWAYRLCRPEEGANIPRTALAIDKIQAVPVKDADSFVADNGLYCRDAAGIDRLIQ